MEEWKERESCRDVTGSRSDACKTLCLCGSLAKIDLTHYDWLGAHEVVAVYHILRGRWEMAGCGDRTVSVTVHHV